MLFATFAARSPEHPARRKKRGVILVALALLCAGTPSAFARGNDATFQDFHFTGTMGLEYSNGSYGTGRNTNVQLLLPTLSVETGSFKFSASMPYMRISGRGLVMFDAAGNPIVINRRTTLPPDTRTGWGDLNLSVTYTLPPSILDDFEVRVSGIAKLPTASERRRLSTGQTDLGMSLDVSRKFGIWAPFVTVGYLSVGQPVGYTLYDTTSVSAGTSLELSENLVAIASYDYDSADGPLVPAAQSLFGSLSWVRDDGFTVTGYAATGLTSGSAEIGGGMLVSYGLN